MVSRPRSTPDGHPEVKHEKSYTDLSNLWLIILYSLDITPPFCRLHLATSMGGFIIEITLVYTPPFLTVERARETAMAELSVTVSCGLR